MLTTSFLLLPSIVSMLNVAAGAVVSFGLYRYSIEPHQAAASLRQKYGTALWITCKELDLHLGRIKSTLNDSQVFDSLLRIPTNDWDNKIDWFTKQGFYTMVTAHRIAQLSAWMYIYQQDLLFSRTKKSSDLLMGLYNHASSIRRAFSQDSCLWPEYFDGIGSLHVERVGEFLRPLSFSSFCMRCSSDPGFMKFYDQLHMFIHLMAKSEPADDEGNGRIPNIRRSLQGMMNLLKEQNLLAGLDTARIGQDIALRRFETHWEKRDRLEPGPESGET